MLRRYIFNKHEVQNKDNVGILNLKSLFKPISTSINDEVYTEYSLLYKKDLDLLTYKLEKLSLPAFNDLLRKTDRTHSFLVDVVDGVVIDSKISNMPLISTLLPRMIDNKCYLNISFDKQFLIKLFCQLHGMKHTEYAIMVNLKNSDTKVIKALTIVERKNETYYILDNKVHANMETVTNSLIKSSIVSCLADDYIMKDISNVQLEKYYIGTFIESVFE